MSRENVEVVRRLYDAQARHDLDTIRELYDPGIEWDDVSGLWGDWGARRGREGVRDAFVSWTPGCGTSPWRSATAPTPKR